MDLELNLRYYYGEPYLTQTKKREIPINICNDNGEYILKEYEIVYTEPSTFGMEHLMGYGIAKGRIGKLNVLSDPTLDKKGNGNLLLLYPPPRGMVFSFQGSNIVYKYLHLFSFSDALIVFERLDKLPITQSELDLYKNVKFITIINALQSKKG